MDWRPQHAGNDGGDCGGGEAAVGCSGGDEAVVSGTEARLLLQISKLLDIARSVANVNNDYSTLEYLLDRLEDLKYVIQDRKVDALVVETFGRRIEKLLQLMMTKWLLQIALLMRKAQQKMIQYVVCVQVLLTYALRIGHLLKILR
nr:probable serine/threonine protein kinase IRE [Ipomoea trifida]GLL42459.1 probable serine/threonine protein kinase IRE [Ipomoea trifida]GLL44829.1 probable serine/threonine protein kinase IRE [Ipomoea trifida]